MLPTRDPTAPPGLLTLRSDRSFASTRSLLRGARRLPRRDLHPLVCCSTDPPPRAGSFRTRHDDNIGRRLFEGRGSGVRGGTARDAFSRRRRRMRGSWRAAGLEAHARLTVCGPARTRSRKLSRGKCRESATRTDSRAGSASAAHRRAGCRDARDRDADAPGQYPGVRKLPKAEESKLVLTVRDEVSGRTDPRSPRFPPCRAARGPVAVGRAPLGLAESRPGWLTGNPCNRILIV